MYAATEMFLCFIPEAKMLQIGSHLVSSLFVLRIRNIHFIFGILI